jgi:hypothetical protein
MMVRAQEKPSPEEIFDYLKMFKHVAVSDEALASRLPEREFELIFNRQRDIYVDGKFLGGTVTQRFEALALR